MKRFQFLQIEAAIVFVVYQLIIFAVWYESGYPAVFWICFAFTFAAFAAIFGNSMILGEQMEERKDWIFSYPILKHSIIYAAVQIIIATLFLIFGINDGWVFSFCVQLAVLGIYWMLTVSCYQARAVAVRVHEEARGKVRWAVEALEQAKQIADTCKIDVVRQEFKKIEEMIRFSDPVSDQMANELEKEILQLLEMAQSVVKVELQQAEALSIAKRLCLLLQERTSRCRVMKYTK